MTVRIKILGDYIIAEVLEERPYHYLIQYDGDWVWFYKRDCEIISE